VSEQLRLRQPTEPIVWQDNEAIHQDVLERDLIKAGGIEPDIMQAAQQRWQQLAQQHQQKMGPQPPQPGSPAGNYQAFLNTVVQDTVSATESMLSKVVETSVMTGGMTPQQAQMTTPQGSVPLRQLNPTQKRPPEGKPMNPRVAPLIGSNPSVAAPPSVAAQGGPGVSNQERATAQFEQRATP
jgi:hypothetical protein